MAKRGRPFKIHAPVAAPADVVAPAAAPDGSVKLVWLGAEGMTETVWNNVTFRIGVPVETSDPYLIGKAKGSRFYEVIE